MIRLSSILRAVCALSFVLASAAGETPSPSTPRPPGQEGTAIEAERLRQQLQLPLGTSLAVRPDGRLYWQVDGTAKAAAYAIVDLDNGGNPRLDTAIGALTADRRLLAEGRTAVLAALPQLVAHAQAAGLKGSDLTLLEGVVTGAHLRSPSHIVLVEGVLAKAEPPARPGGDRAALAGAAKQVTSALEASDLDPLGRRTLVEVLGRLDQEEGMPEADELPPSFVRRVMRHGWLRQVLPKSDADEKLEQAVLGAEQLLPVRLFQGRTAEGAELMLAEVRDAYGLGGWVLRTPQRSAYYRPLPRPWYYWALPDRTEDRPALVVELAPGADPLAAVPAPRAARVCCGNQVIARWQAGGGVSADLAEWRRWVPATPQQARQGIDRHAVAEVMPPHVLVVGLNGDVHGLAVAGGLLRPPRDGSPGEAERFLADAARLLPDAGALDLIGEYLFQYVYDSPDSRYPQLIGTKGDKGDIHQTAAQTIATNAGGQFRGDCDDLAELYQAIAERQGRTAHVISLPAHAATAWAERKEDGKWHVYVLQTGPALEFADANLPQALGQAYRKFDATETFDPNGLGLLLRFSGENTRSSWRLSWRIFSEPDYARTMIDVQRDWHYQTYARGIAKMEALIAKGDRDNANYRELAGLSTFTGQYAQAVRWTEQAIAATPEPLSKLYLRLELVPHLLDAGRDEAAEALLAELLERQIPAHRRELGPSLIHLAAELTAHLVRHRRYRPAVRVLDQCLQRAEYALVQGRDGVTLPDLIDDLGQRLASPEFADEQRRKAWREDQRMERLRHLMAQYASLATSVLELAGREAVPGDPALQTAARATQRWLNDLAFTDLEEAGDVFFRYAATGRYYRTVLGEAGFASLLDAAKPLAAATRIDHGRRIGGLAQLPLDLPWVRNAVPYWSGLLAERLARERPLPSTAEGLKEWREETLRLTRAAAEAWATTRTLGLEQSQLQHQAHLAALLAAAVSGDQPALRERLAFVAAKQDKRLRDDSAQWLGDVARFLPLERWGQVLDAWEQEVGRRDARGGEAFDKAKWFWIAWRAWLTGGRAHALATAERAAARFRDDPSFSEELEFMRKLAAPAK